MSQVPKSEPQPRYRANLQGEVDSAAIYTALAEGERDPNLAAIFRRLAAVEAAHATFWRRRIERGGTRVAPRPTARARVLAWLARRFGPAFVLPAIAPGKAGDRVACDDQPEAAAEGPPTDEQSHARVMREVAEEAASRGGLSGPAIAMLEGRHRGGGNALRAAVLGANDGLVSNLSLVMGMAGAAATEKTILLTGFAGLVSGALSMAMGEWISVTSSRELYQNQIATEAAELKSDPQEEKEELTLIYQGKGLDEPQARALAEKLLANQDTALDTLVREELGVDPKGLGGSAWQAAASSFFLFALGAIFPVAPFLFLQGQAAQIVSVLLSAAALILIGAATSLFTGRGIAFSGFRQLLIGLAAAGVTYGVGAVMGVSLS